MDAFKAAKVIVDRIKELEPRTQELMTPHILLTQIPGQELIRLALGPNSSILNLIQKLHNASLIIPPTPPIMAPFSSSYASYYDGPNNIVSSADQRCRYFNKGYCKHGNNCRYYHDESFGDGDEFDQVIYYGALKKLELEVVHLLKSQRGCPVSIASLPMMYFDMYGRSLQADGYLSESQRHGKAGYSLTKLLARLNAIRLIDRPHGQHAVVLAEDAPKYMDMHGGHDQSGCRQIYLTFPPESTFSEEDVATYFSKFGAVEDVRIPWQERRMFGFVTFVSASTVKWILSKGSPHYVCGARVLAKPYREKSKLAQRKYLENFDSCTYPIPMDHINLRLQQRPYKVFNMEEHENSLEREMRRLTQLQIATQGYSIVPHDELNAADNTEMCTINNDCIADDKESAQGLNLPDRPFESP